MEDLDDNFDLDFDTKEVPPEEQQPQAPPQPPQQEQK
jgi:hypothetical protein